MKNSRRITRFIAVITLVAGVLAIEGLPKLGGVSAAVSQPTGLSVLKTDVEQGRKRLTGVYAVLGGKTYFSGKTTANGDELWVTDGTTDGTLMLKDINPGSSPSNPHFFFTVGSKVLFVAEDGTSGSELWATDGTAAGTVLLKDIETGAGSSVPGARDNISLGSGYSGDGMNVINGKLYFSASTTAAGREPWVSDGTSVGTQMMSDVRPGATGSMALDAGPFLPAGGKVVFPANNGTDGIEPMVYDGTSVSLLANVSAGSNNGWQGRAVVLGNNVFFNGYNGNKYSTWKTDGTTAGTVHAINVALSSIAAFGNRLLLFGEEVIHETSQAGQYEFPARLWISDGTQGGTSFVSRINPTSYPSITFFQQVGSRYVFGADDGTNGGELWTTDGTAGGTQLLVDAFPGSTGAISSFAAYEDSFMFVNQQSSFGFAFLNVATVSGYDEFKGFITDGTPAGTSALAGNPVRSARSPIPAGSYLAGFSEWGSFGSKGLLVTAPGSDSRLTQLGVMGAKRPMSFTSPSPMPAQGTPQFSASVTSYSLNLANGLNTAVISPQVSTAPGAPTCVIEGAACTANSGNHEFTITAPRFIEVVVTAGNGTKTTYTISVSLNGVAPVAPTTTVPVTTTPARATAVTTAPAPSTTPEAAVVPGVTVTDTKVYSASAPKKVASGSAITVMTPAQAKERDVVSLTPQICLAADDDLVFIKTGRCVAQVVSEKTGNVLRTLRTTVVADEVSELNVGNEIVTLAPIYFAGGSSEVDAKALKRLARLKKQVSDAGTVLLVGHTGILTGNTPENQQMGRARAIATRKALLEMGAKGPFYFTSAGALDPATKTKTIAAQAENRRVIVVLIP